MAIEIDGSMGEGGGQVLRTALSLSAVTGQAFRMVNIRAGRERPGFLRQHLTAALATAELCGAEVRGAELGSASLEFSPGPVRPGEYHFTVGTAGSGTLVLQTVLPALMLADGPSQVTIEGGTHNPAAPPFPFLARAFAPLVARMGPKIELSFERYGFYPAGGGRFGAVIQPVRALKPLHVGPRGELVTRRVTAVVANLNRRIAEREVSTACSLLGWGPETREVVTTRESAGPGNAVMVEVCFAEVTEVFTAFGQIGVSAERVATLAARDAQAYLASTAAAGEHLTDQLLLPLALAGGGSFTAVKLNRHALTNMEVIARFLPVSFVTSTGEGATRVEVVRAA